MATRQNETLKQGQENEVKRDEYGSYMRLSRSNTTDKVCIVPCEIEMSSELYEAITLGFEDIIEYRYGTLEAFVQDRFIERMQQILSDPVEFGKIYLEDFRRAHSLQNACDITSD